MRRRTSTPAVHASREVEDWTGTIRAGNCPKRAVLILAVSLPLDLCRRHLPGRTGRLLRFPLSELETLETVDIHLFSSGTGEPVSLPRRQCHLQQGASFKERLETAVNTLVCLGYEQLVIVGRDCPDLTASDIEAAFRFLQGKRLVLGPDHRGGLYLIGLSASDASLLKGIVWQQNRDCEQLSSRLSGNQVAFLEVKQDLDDWNDLLILARNSRRWARLANSLLARFNASAFPETVSGSPGRPRIERLSWQLPPPSVTP